MATVIRSNPAATALRGLDGRNPMGALAAMGAQAVFFGDDNPPNLWWTNDHALHAMADAGVEEIAERAMARFAESIAGPALSPDKSLKGASALKFQNREDTRKYLPTRATRASGTPPSRPHWFARARFRARAIRSRPTSTSWRGGSNFSTWRGRR